MTNLCVSEVIRMILKIVKHNKSQQSASLVSGGRFKNTYELLYLRALKFSTVDKIYIFQCVGKIFGVGFQRFTLKFHTDYLTHTLKYMIFTHQILTALGFNSSYAFSNFHGYIFYATQLLEGQMDTKLALVNLACWSIDPTLIISASVHYHNKGHWSSFIGIQFKFTPAKYQALDLRLVVICFVQLFSVLF